MMKKHISAILVLSLLLGVAPLIHAQLPENAGPPTFEVTTEIAPDLEVTTEIEADRFTVTAGQPVTLTATTSYTSNKGERQTLRFVSDAWQGVDAAAEALPLGIEAEPAGAVNERQAVFVSTANLIVSTEPGDYDVAVNYTITLEHDASGKRVYTATASYIFSVTVLEPETEQEEEPEAEPSGTPLNHGQIVSTWAQWRQGKGNQNFRKGGPGVYRSLNWYKTQVEYKTFYTKQEVIDYLESIYEPAPKEKPGKGNNPGKGNGKPGK